MASQVTITFQVEDRFQVQAGSGTSFFVDKKHENQVPAGPNPLEVMLSSLGACIGVYAKNYLTRHAIAFKSLSISVSADLSEDPPARLVNIKALVKTDANLEGKKDVFMKFIHNCPVHNTLLNTKEVAITLEAGS